MVQLVIPRHSYADWPHLLDIKHARDPRALPTLHILHSAAFRVSTSARASFHDCSGRHPVTWSIIGRFEAALYPVLSHVALSIPI